MKFIQGLVIGTIIKDHYYIVFNEFNQKVIIHSSYFYSRYPTLKKSFFIMYCESKNTYHGNSSVWYPYEIEIVKFFPLWINKFSATIDFIFFLLDNQQERNFNNNCTIWNIIQKYLLEEVKQSENQKLYMFECLTAIVEIIFDITISYKNCEHDYKNKILFLKKNLYEKQLLKLSNKKIFNLIDYCIDEFASLF